MTNLDARPDAEICEGLADLPGPCVRVFEQRDVPLGGVRDMQVTRTLPLKGLPTIGAWCFLDDFGPTHQAMTVLPHPHTGLQTVTWPLTGRIRHRDSVGSDVIVEPGQLNIMTAGRGISHSEVSVSGPTDTPSVLAPEPEELSGLQFWIALPDEHRNREPLFEQHLELPHTSGPGWEAVVVLGTLNGVSSTATVFSPTIGAQLTLDGEAEIPLNPGFEHAVVVINGSLSVEGTQLERGPLVYLGGRRDSVLFNAEPGTRVFLLGGEPLGEDLLMWWNFVGRTQEEIQEQRLAWEATESLYAHDVAAPSDAEIAANRFGWVAGHQGEGGPHLSGRIPAPELPSVNMKARTRRL